MRSLAFGGHPYLCLLSIHAQLAGAEGPHAMAARRVLERIVDDVASRADRYPAIDAGRNVMNQLYLLSADEISETARRLYGAGGSGLL